MIKPVWRWGLALPLCLVVGGAAIAQQHALAGVAPCATNPIHRLDQRIGTFIVHTAKGILAGQARVEPVLGGCALVEHWQGAVSGQGQGTWFYDPAARLWRLVYINQSGNVLDLSGRFFGTNLILLGKGLDFKGRPGMHRMTWSALDDGTIRQLWEFSADGSTSWQVLLDARQTRMP